MQITDLWFLEEKKCTEFLSKNAAELNWHLRKYFTQKMLKSKSAHWWHNKRMAFASKKQFQLLESPFSLFSKSKKILLSSSSTQSASQQWQL